MFIDEKKNQLFHLFELLLVFYILLQIPIETMKLVE